VKAPCGVDRCGYWVFSISKIGTWMTTDPQVAMKTGSGLSLAYRLLSPSTCERALPELVER